MSLALEKEKGTKRKVAVTRGPRAKDRVSSALMRVWVFLVVSLLPTPQPVYPDRLSLSRVPWLEPMAEMSWCHPKQRPF